MNYKHLLNYFSFYFLCLIKQAFMQCRQWHFDKRSRLPNLQQKQVTSGDECPHSMSTHRQCGHHRTHNSSKAAKHEPSHGWKPTWAGAEFVTAKLSSTVILDSPPPRRIRYLQYLWAYCGGFCTGLHPRYYKLMHVRQGGMLYNAIQLTTLFITVATQK